ncbi:putative protein FAM10A4 [Venturia canescens]|uniref:putative protein FAM10A4 n=1 Tax=Venturia canescens TaxID=32260 RepID=UPI001C9C6F1E|nr:putative protein FAM10A4 [Venturia canescens]
MLPPITKEQMVVFLEALKKNPSLLHTPDFESLKSFVEHFGGKIPYAAKSEAGEPMGKEPEEKKSKPEPEVESEESEESDLELDMTGVLEPDNDSPQKMGNLTKVSTEEEITESHAKRSEAVSAFMEKDYEKALGLYTEAIVLNPQAALLYAKRGQIYLLLGKPNACIRDCDRALELNPDSAAGHKFRGRAYQLLGRFEEAAADLRLACKFDFDDQTNEWLREVTPNALKIEEHRRKRDRKAKERAARKSAKAKSTKENVYASKPEGSKSEGDSDAGKKKVNFAEMLNAFQDPEITQMFLDISTNPANIKKYENNPKMMEILSKFCGSDGKDAVNGLLGFLKGMGGLYSGAGGATANPPPAAEPKPSAPKASDEVELD